MCISLLISVSLLQSSVLGWVEQKPTRSALPGPRVGHTAPDFSLDDTKGQPWHLHRLKGKSVVLVFACGCTYCTLIIRRFTETRARPDHVVVISSLPPTTIDRMIGRASRSIAGLFDPFGKIAAVYSSHQCPRVWALNAEQVICYSNKPGTTDPVTIVTAAIKASMGKPIPLREPPKGQKSGLRVE